MLPLTPTKLGRYEIVDEIGKGAMGVVYLARDPLIGRLVALKTFRIGYSVRDVELEQFRARFIREAQSAGILSHPNIVTIHDVVEESEDGIAFIAMEYVRGTNLKSLLQGDQPLSLPFVVDVIAQVADALDYAHSHRVIHRDVKPANILITADNRVKITDFGIARLDTSNLTQEGQLLGTPNYMAPEQIQGKEVDYRADLFALGVVLYEMLTRHKPFQGENLTVVSHRIVYDHFTPPREYMREMPPGIEPILDRALEKDPARRFQRAKEMVDELRRTSGALAGADLNETQSLSLIAPDLAPPPYLPSDTTGGGTPLPLSGSTGSMGSASASVGPAQEPPKPPKPPRTGPLVSPRRAAAVAALALAALVAVVVLFLWRPWAQQRGHEADKVMASATPVAASPSPQPVPAAEPAASPPVGDQPEVSDQLAKGQQALAARRWNDAIVAAKAVQAVDPVNPEAQQILAQAEQGQARSRLPSPAPRTSKKGQPQVAATVPASEPSPAESHPAEPVSQVATLRVSFDSAVGGANVMVYAGKDKLLQQSVGERGGLLRKGKAGNLDGSYQLAPGGTNLRVYVTPPGQKSLNRTVAATFLAGQSRHLEIRLSSDSQLEVALH